MTVLREILSIKEFRENKAEMAVRRQREALDKAQRERDSANRRLDEFRDFATAREQQLFEDLCSRQVRVREIQEVHLAVGELRGQEREFEQVLGQAREREQEESQVLDERKSAHQVATRMTQKFIELVRVHADEELRGVERKEDAEMEEVVELRRDRSDGEDLIEEAA